MIGLPTWPNPATAPGLAHRSHSLRAPRVAVLAGLSGRQACWPALPYAVESTTPAGGNPPSGHPTACPHSRTGNQLRCFLRATRLRAVLRLRFRLGWTPTPKLVARPLRFLGAGLRPPKPTDSLGRVLDFATLVLPDQSGRYNLLIHRFWLPLRPVLCTGCQAERLPPQAA